MFRFEHFDMKIRFESSHLNFSIWGFDFIWTSNRLVIQFEDLRQKAEATVWSTNFFFISPNLICRERTGSYVLKVFMLTETRTQNLVRIRLSLNQLE